MFPITISEPVGFALVGPAAAAEEPAAPVVEDVPPLSELPQAAATTAMPATAAKTLSRLTHMFLRLRSFFTANNVGRLLPVARRIAAVEVYPSPDAGSECSGKTESLPFPLSIRTSLDQETRKGSLIRDATRRERR
ncbi:hypothetical protein [Pseudofrankia asymbiotica]|uniref:hypothetical protein n=1 Tax=Pseudofrankia asymbiotica TaxID=1834516 RepID=UPI0013041AC4|nr:hypothetical protein [Pseudofrankia asymbiotica]